MINSYDDVPDFVEIPTCKPRNGKCNKPVMKLRIEADVRVAWIDFKFRSLCEKHAKQWDDELVEWLKTVEDSVVFYAWYKAQILSMALEQENRKLFDAIAAIK